MKKERKGLTERQQAILNFVRHYIAEYGYPPSVREIAKGVGLYSSSTVHMHLRHLEEMGYLRRGSARSRALELLPKAELFTELSKEEAGKENFYEESPSAESSLGKSESDGGDKVRPEDSFLKGSLLFNSVTVEVDVDKYGNIDTASFFSKLSQLTEGLNNRPAIFLRVHEKEWDLEESTKVLGEKIKPGDYLIVLLQSDFYPGDFWVVMQGARLRITRVESVPLSEAKIEKGRVIGKMVGIIRLFSGFLLTELL